MDSRVLTTSKSTTPRLRSSASLGERIRELRTTRRLTQSELAGERFSKEYISQIERGKTRPTAQTLAWLAERLGVDVRYLESGVSATEYGRTEAAIAQAEAAIQAKNYADAIALVKGLAHSPEAPELELRAILAESWGRMYVGEVRAALDLLERARSITQAEQFSDLERAEVLYRFGCCRYKLSSINLALGLYTEALALTERAAVPCDRLRSNILQWRSRCYRRQRDWEAAREDIERALELAEAQEDPETVAHAYFQASLVAERNGQWLQARSHAERAKALYELVDDQINVGRMLNNLGGLSFLLGSPEKAVTYLKEAFRVALEVGSKPDAAQAVSSLSQVHLRGGEFDLAEQQARHALELLEGRIDYLDEIGNAQLVLGRSLLEQDRLDEAGQMFDEAEATLSQLSSASHRAAAWTAQGDLATRRGDDRSAAQLYRRAAETLQDVRF